MKTFLVKLKSWQRCRKVGVTVWFRVTCVCLFYMKCVLCSVQKQLWAGGLWRFKAFRKDGSVCVHRLHYHWHHHHLNFQRCAFYHGNPPSHTHTHTLTAQTCVIFLRVNVSSLLSCKAKSEQITLIHVNDSSVDLISVPGRICVTPCNAGLLYICSEHLASVETFRSADQ